MKKRKLDGENNSTQNELEKKYYKKEGNLFEDENKGKKEDLIIYSKFIQEVVSEINFARTKPSE